MGDEPDAPDVGVAIFSRKPEALGEIGAHDVAVEHFHFETGRAQLRLQKPCERRLASTRQAGEPDDKTFT
jgi:hypothetical protein